MSLLLVDIGNTRLKWAIQSGDELQPGRPTTYDKSNIRLTLDQCWAPIEPPERILASCVAAGTVCRSVENWINQHWKIEPAFLVSPEQANGVTNAYAQPGQLGSDRWAAMVEAYNRVSSAVCVVSCGTAITLDVIDDAGRHLGGFILPGFETMKSALADKTNVSLEIPLKVVPFRLGTTTQEGIQLGTIYSVSSFVSGTINWLKSTTSLSPACILTGGDAEQLSAILEYPHTVNESLVLKGLARIARGT